MTTYIIGEKHSVHLRGCKDNRHLKGNFGFQAITCWVTNNNLTHLCQMNQKILQHAEDILRSELGLSGQAKQTSYYVASYLSKLKNSTLNSKSTSHGLRFGLFTNSLMSCRSKVCDFVDSEVRHNLKAAFQKASQYIYHIEAGPLKSSANEHPCPICPRVFIETSEEWSRRCVINEKAREIMRMAVVFHFTRGPGGIPDGRA